jgi:multidrug efflux pump subunit AcrA (membrane-fusion protein)
MKKSFIRRPFVYVPIVVVIILIIFVVVFRGSSTKYETTIAKRGNFKLEVSASGRVVAKDRADLGFEQNGKISAIYAKVGDSVKIGSPIASIENADLKAELAQKSANLAKEQAKLASLLQGTRPEQLVIDKQTIATTDTAVTNTPPTPSRSLALDTKVLPITNVI